MLKIYALGLEIFRRKIEVSFLILLLLAQKKFKKPNN